MAEKNTKNPEKVATAAKEESAPEAPRARRAPAAAGPHARLAVLRLPPPQGPLPPPPNPPPGGGPTPLAKLLRSAVANAEQKGGHVDVDRLYVKTLTVDGGPKMRRFMPRAMGRAFRIEKRTSHVY